MFSADAFQKFLLLLPLVYSTSGDTYDDTQKSPNWSYNTESWGDDYPQCNGYLQSPILLNTSDSLNILIDLLYFWNYNVPLANPITLMNDGHSIAMTIPVTKNGDRPYIPGGILTSNYEAQSLHFHWGSNGDRGSEHVINESRYDVEMHIVHKNVYYETMDEAIQDQDGLVVLAIMFKIVNKPDRYYPGLNKVFNLLPSPTEYKSEATINGEVTLEQFLGDIDTQKFYLGSLTTPPCSEAVTWQVFPEALPIARSNITKFWDILDSHGDPLLNNYRPLQQRNLRAVFYRNINQY